MAGRDLSRWRAVVVVSGDGLLHEVRRGRVLGDAGQVLNGLFEREDWASACKLPVGVIPGGTGNGLARWKRRTHGTEQNIHFVRTISHENNDCEEDSPVRQVSHYKCPLCVQRWFHRRSTICNPCVHCVVTVCPPYFLRRSTVFFRFHMGPPCAHHLSTVCHRVSTMSSPCVHCVSTLCSQSVHRLTVLCPMSVHRASTVRSPFVHPGKQL